MVNAYFLDSSALVKRYVAETGSDWILSITAPVARNPLLIARITWIEVLSALTRRLREGSLSPSNVEKAIQAFRYDMDTQYQVVELDRSLAESAGQLVRKHLVRAYDAVQLASVFQVQPAFARTKAISLTFITADERLIAIAQAEGLLADNPVLHPSV